jgi:hypothetical protein
MPSTGMEDNFERKVGSYLFVHSSIDDAGLSPLEFRLLGHLSRRAGRDGQITSSVANMAEVTGVSPGTLKKALKGLRKMNIFRTAKRRCTTSLRFLNHPSEWRLVGSRLGKRVDKDAAVKNLPPNGTDSIPSVGTNFVPTGGIKSVPLRLSPEGNPEKEISDSLLLSFSKKFRSVWATWEAHCREKDVRLTSQAKALQLQRCVAWGEDWAEEVILHSISRNWKSLHESHFRPSPPGNLASTQSCPRSPSQAECETVDRVRKTIKLLALAHRSEEEIDDLMTLAGTLDPSEWEMLDFDEKNNLVPFLRKLASRQSKRNIFQFQLTNSSHSAHPHARARSTKATNHEEETNKYAQNEETVA